MSDFICNAEVNDLIKSEIVYISNDAKCGKNITSFRLKSSTRKPLTHNFEKIIIASGAKFTLICPPSGVLHQSNYLNKNDEWIDAFVNINKVRHIKGKNIIIGNAGYRNYYHYTFQIWMALVYLKAQSIGFNDYNVIGPPLNSWRKQYIDILGVINYIEVDPQSAYMVDKAVFTDIMWGDFAYCPSSEFLKLIDLIELQTKENTPKKIYISRRDTAKRGLTNEDAVEQMLTGYGYETVLLSGMTVTDQIGLFRNARSIIAPHGAGLTNLIFCKPKTALIELLPDDYLNPCFLTIAMERNIDYRATINATENIGNNRYHSSKMKVDIPLLEKIIQHREKI